MTAPSYPQLPLDLRDRLALERTRLANERTLLAYLRTGLSLINFFLENLYVWVGVGLVPLGVAMAVGSWFRFRTKRKRIHASVQAQYDPARK